MSKEKKPDCSQHKKDLFGKTDMKEVAEAIGDLHYETLAELLNRLWVKIKSDGINDMKAGRELLGEYLRVAALRMKDSAEYISEAWKISKKHMNETK